MLDFSAIPPADLLILALLLALILGVLWLRFHARKTPLPPQPLSARRILTGFLRLAGFGLLCLFFIAAVLMVYEDYRTMKAETAPARQNVELPPGLSFAVEEVTFTGGDETRLAGWYVPSTNGATIILLHGYGGTRASMLWHAQALVKAGYGVLLYDERATGESGGSRRSFGWEDGPDVGGAIAFIKERAGATPEKIGILGCSMGGGIALQGAILYPEIGAVWADGPSNIRAADNPPPQNLITGLTVVSNYVLDFLYVQHLKIPAPPPMIDRIGSIAPRPIMLVAAGTEKGLLGSEAPKVHRYARFAGSNAQVWVIDDAVHCDGPTRHPEEYARRLVQFFDAAFALNE